MRSTSTNRFSPLHLKNQKTLRNRVVIPPMAGIHSDEQLEGLSQLSKLIQATGTLAGIQLSHSGAKKDSALSGGTLMGPSAIAVPVKNRILETPREMTMDDIELWKSAFSAAVDRAVLAGFDLVEFHSAHGYGLNQWLSAITNQRQDQYGGTLQNRMRLLLEIVTDAKAKHPSLLISVRIPGQDFIQGGLSLEDSIELAQALETAGVDLLHVSSGIGGWQRPTPRLGEGYLVHEAAKIQASVGVPVVGVGGIETGPYIDDSLAAKHFALAAVGRAILKDPRGWESQICKRTCSRALLKLCN